MLFPQRAQVQVILGIHSLPSLQHPVMTVEARVYVHGILVVLAVLTAPLCLGDDLLLQFLEKLCQRFALLFRQILHTVCGAADDGITIGI